MLSPHFAAILARARRARPGPEMPGLAGVLTGVLAAWLSSAALAQPVDLPALRPLSMTSVEAALNRLPGTPTTAARTRGALDLKGRQVYIAEYLLLIDLSGELPATPRDGRLLGMAVAPGPAVLAYRARHDIAVLQALTDAAWADLQARLADAGLVPADAAALTKAHGAVHETSEAASTPDAPVLQQASQAGSTRRWLVMAPSGMRRVPRNDDGLGAGNPAARLAHAAARVEGLSLAMAINLSALDASGSRAPAFAAPGGLPTLSPLMELAPAPAAPLVLAHAQQARVTLAEALVPTAPFGRLRMAPMDGPIPSNDPLKPLLSITRQPTGDGPAHKVEALLDLDGAATARLLLALASAANQAITDALKAARQ